MALKGRYKCPGQDRQWPGKGATRVYERTGGGQGREGHLSGPGQAVALKGRNKSRPGQALPLEGRDRYPGEDR